MYHTYIIYLVYIMYMSFIRYLSCVYIYHVYDVSLCVYIFGYRPGTLKKKNNCPSGQHESKPPMGRKTQILPVNNRKTARKDDRKAPIRKNQWAQVFPVTPPLQQKNASQRAQRANSKGHHLRFPAAPWKPPK